MVMPLGFSPNVYADWDTKLPSNLEDRDLFPDTQTLPPPRSALTIISSCLSGYQILYMQRDKWQHGGTRRALSWLLSSSVPLAEKDAMVDISEKALREQFLQHCDPLNPVHVYIQIHIRSYVLSARRVARQPALVNVKISEMSSLERDEFLRICTRSLEYYVLIKTTNSLRGFHWHVENYFPWVACE